jgi:hypothetical protein
LIAVDANLLVYAHRHDAEWHKRAVEIVTEISEARAPWAIPWPCLHEFLAIVTKRIYVPPTPLKVALETIDAWRESPSLVLLSEAEDHWPTLKSLLGQARIVGGAVHDARIAAICIAHGVSELLSADRDFSRFPQLKVRNPLV